MIIDKKIFDMFFFDFIMYLPENLLQFLLYLFTLLLYLCYTLSREDKKILINKSRLFEEINTFEYFSY
jgi:hypothetical protein